MNPKESKTIFYFVKPYYLSFIFIAILAVVDSILLASQPVLIQRIIDLFISGINSDGIYKYIFLLCILLISQFILMHFYILKSGILCHKIVHDIRIQLFKHIQELDIKYFNNTQLGTLIDIQTSELERVSSFFTEGCAEFGVEIIKIIVIIALMFYINAMLASVGLSLIILFFAIIFIFQIRIKSMYTQGLNVWTSLSSFIHEQITGMSIIQIFNNEKNNFEKFKEINKSHKDINIDTERYYSLYFPITDFLIALGTGLIITVGSMAIIKGYGSGGTSVGTLISFIIFFGMLFGPITILLFKLNIFQLGMISSKRIFNFLNEKPQIINNGKLAPIDFKGDIKFDSVWFAYKNEEHILKNVSFDIKAGQTIGIVGKTGSGKSTIINLCCRFYEVQKGRIYIDDHLIQEYDLQSLRRKIGIVQQDSFLFSTSLRENITLFNSEISDENIWRACERMGCKQFIDGLSGKLDYRISENGSNLSGGEKQLICILRCILHDPQIIIFDEATSSVDFKYEKLIQDAIGMISKGKTCIIIAHRLSSVKNADKIIVMDKGEILESGTHQELLKNKGTYKSLYEYQF